ncbi:MAG: signal peptide peptidase SppA [Desulfotomaculum sp.]|nr:signal peptide peptidase SppA [Desulfotomaculum sp.]
MKKKVITGIIVLVLVLSVALTAIFKDLPATDRPTQVLGNAVGIIDITGPIVSGGSGGGFSSDPQAGSTAVINQLREAAANPDIQAVVLYLNSPGGSPAASLEIGNEIQRFRQQDKQVVAYMSDMAASGAYWIASQTDIIVANPTTMTGSIGVVMQTMEWHGLQNLIGLETNTFKSGPHKDIGSPCRDITAIEANIFQSMIDDIYQQFITVVAEGRNMELTEVKKLADGRVYTGRQAFELGLVDELGDMKQAVQVAADLAGIEGEPHIINLTPVSFWDEFMGQMSIGSKSPWSYLNIKPHYGPMLLPPHYIK